jgi:4-hydroxy-3-methylbut-2-enyl diphosphate reductase
MQQLRNKGLKIINSLDEIEQPGYLILPSHGSGRALVDAAQRRGLKVVDTACPYVSYVHKIIRKLYRQGYQIVIVGDKRHPEVKALLHSAPGSAAIERKEDIKTMLPGCRIGIISQTTQAQAHLCSMIDMLLEKNTFAKEVRIFNTICLDARRRQAEVKDLAKTCNTVLVIGSAISANTRRLYSISKGLNKNTYLIQVPEECDKRLRHIKSVGIISGASAPEWLVGAVVDRCRQLPLKSNRCQKRRNKQND